MSVPASQTFSVTTLVGVHTWFRDLIDSHATLPGLLRLRDAADVLLSEVPLADPCGAVNVATGQLTFDIDPTPRDESANAGGVIAYGEICDGYGDVHLALPAQAGTVAVSGKIVANTLTVVAGGPVEVFSVTVG